MAARDPTVTLTRRARDPSKLIAMNIHQQREEDYKNSQLLNLSARDFQFIYKHDWTRTRLFHECVRLPRLQKPSLEDKTENTIINYITNLRLNPEGNSKAHILMPMYEVATEHLQYILVNQLGFPKFYLKIVKQYKRIDYQSTLKILVRARICSQLKQDATLLICKYLDFMVEQRNLEQLRDENASDKLIQVQIWKMVKQGKLFVYRGKKFMNDFQKMLKLASLQFGDINIIEEVERLLDENLDMQKYY